jgi:hypothetical protein
MNGNPGAPYPQVLQKFQYSILNSCQPVGTISRQIVLVKAPPRKFMDGEILQDLDDIILKNFFKNPLLLQSLKEVKEDDQLKFSENLEENIERELQKLEIDDFMLQVEAEIKNDEYNGRMVLVVPGHSVELTCIKDNKKTGEYIKIDTNGKITNLIYD